MLQRPLIVIPALQYRSGYVAPQNITYSLNNSSISQSSSSSSSSSVCRTPCVLSETLRSSPLLCNTFFSSYLCCESQSRVVVELKCQSLTLAPLARCAGAQRGGGLWAGAKNGQFANCRTCFVGAGWGPGRVFEPRHAPVLRHEHVVRRHARLPRIHEAAEQHAARGERGVRGRVDDDGRFAAELGGTKLVSRNLAGEGKRRRTREGIRWEKR